MSSQLADDEREYEFRCPHCTEVIEVNAGMRDALLEHGCVVCGTPVPEASFTLLS